MTTGARHGLALTVADYESIERWAKALATVGGLVGGAYAVLVRVFRRWRIRRDRRRLEAKAVRYLLDAQHHVLRLLNNGSLPPDEIKRQAILIKDLRRDMAEVDGHQEFLLAADNAESRSEIIRILTRTQAIEARKVELRAKQAKG